MRMVVWGLIFLSIAIGMQGCNRKTGPTIGPADIEMAAWISPTDVKACRPDVHWVLTVTLNTKRDIPLSAGASTYLSAVYAFDGQHPLTPDDYGAGCGKEDLDLLAQVRVGNDGHVYPLAVHAAQNTGALPVSFSELSSEGGGVSYSGTSFPITIRYYLTDRSLDSEPPTIIYAYFEHHAGKDLSWTKAVQAGSQK